MPELMLVAGSQPLSLHKPNSRLPLPSTRPAVTRPAHVGLDEIILISDRQLCQWLVHMPIARKLIPFDTEERVKHNEASVSPHVNWTARFINDQHF